MASSIRRFKALLEKANTQGLGWTVARLPFVPGEVWPQMIRLRVCGSVNGVPFRTSLFPDPTPAPGAPDLDVDARYDAGGADEALGPL